LFTGREEEMSVITLSQGTLGNSYLANKACGIGRRWWASATPN